MNKLYTEEQMIKAFHYGKTLEPFDCFDDFIESLTPIQLPTDEEIKNTATHLEPNVTRRAFQSGAKWMRDKIKGCDNE